MERRLLQFILVVCLFVPGLYAQSLPSHLSDQEFWRMVSEFSEDGGFFQFDNFMSNEDALQWVIPDLQRQTKPGGVFIGVGPEQNFTYIAALESKMAFIIDIRRQNMLEHLLYKALFELSSDRADFLSKLFSRPRPPGLDSDSPVGLLFERFQPVTADRSLLETNRRAVVEYLTTRGFTLSQDDTGRVAYIYDAFFEGGPDLTYATTRFFNGGQVTYASLMTATDQQGRLHSFLASEAKFRYIQEMQRKNLIVPLVGDFAGPKALRAIGDYLQKSGTTLTAFYASNVEQYLFQHPDQWKKFYANVEALPMDASSTFIRSFTPLPGGTWFSTLAPMMENLRAFREGRLRFYADIMPR
jgi:hypothetical protein